MSKNGKTVKAAVMENTEYLPVYVTINASNNPALVGYAIQQAMKEAYEYKQLLYITVNSGQPPVPPVCPPGMNCNG